jgi:phosphatidate cytidylyltransferase
MIAGAAVIVASGHLSVILMIVVIQTMVFKEVIAIAHVPSKEKKLPWFRVINW